MLTAHFDTKILPRIGPTAYGGEVTEGKHLGRTIRWSPQCFEWESNSKHVEDMVELCGLKLGSKGAPTPITKATGRGRRDIDDTLNETDAQTFRQAAGTGLYMSIDRPSLQFAMSVVTSVAGSARSTVCSATSGRDLVVRIPSRPENTVCVHRHGLGSRRADQEICIVHCGEVWQSHD